MILALPLAVIAMYLLYKYAQVKIALRHIARCKAKQKYWEKKLGI